MLDLQSSELKINEQLKVHKLNRLQLCMNFTNLYNQLLQPTHLLP